ncbi:hypothetical protein BVI434_590007 [Burkholderia vietnamiensis]|nr:hypothetical protein BVI434_590007 [Burkholderia vietnamiensis]
MTQTMTAIRIRSNKISQSNPSNRVAGSARNSITVRERFELDAEAGHDADHPESDARSRLDDFVDRQSHWRLSRTGVTRAVDRSGSIE